MWVKAVRSAGQKTFGLPAKTHLTFSDGTGLGAASAPATRVWGPTASLSHACGLGSDGPCDLKRLAPAVAGTLSPMDESESLPDKPESVGADATPTRVRRGVFGAAGPSADSVDVAARDGTLRVGPTEEAGSTLLHCPIRGPLNAKALAKDGLTPTEEARRIDFIQYLLDRGYPSDKIAVETVVITGLGEKGRSQLRADVIVYDIPAADARHLQLDGRVEHALLVAEIKRDAASKSSGLKSQLLPAMRLLPGMNVLGAYWDDLNRLLFIKELVKREGGDLLRIREDSLANLPGFSRPYRSKPITFDTLVPPENLVSTLFSIANVMRSHGVNDEETRYRETVKLLLARYCDEKAARERADREVMLQVHEGPDADFRQRVDRMYEIAATRYSRAETLFAPKAVSALSDQTLRDIVKAIQGLDFSSATNETMQQVFMTFVPSVFKKSLDQYFTPVTLIETMVQLAGIGPNDKVADPAMGTGDFLTAAMSYRLERGDSEILLRVYGMDSDPKAYDLAIVNMILNRDGQANLVRGDSIAQPNVWAGEIGVALCNPPFGSRTVETRPDILSKYDLGHIWKQEHGEWVMTDELMNSQQLGILFIERCYKLLTSGGRLGIILPEGYLATTTYGYVRRWILDHLRVLALVELPRRIFLKSDADLRSNVLIAEKGVPAGWDYPVYAALVRRVGYKLGKGFSPVPERDSETGLELRDSSNQIVLASDFARVREGFARVRDSIETGQEASWVGARLSDINNDPTLDMKPRRLTPRALINLRDVKAGPHIRLGDVAEVVDETVDLTKDVALSEFRRLVEGQDIRAVEGTALAQEPTRCWAIAERKSRKAFVLRHRDIIVGLVRPERRNIGLLVSDGTDMVGTPDGIAVVRPRPEQEDAYPRGWLFAALRSEAVRLQFWTESGGTSYGKLTRSMIEDVLLPLPEQHERKRIDDEVNSWAGSTETAHDVWSRVGTEADRKAILNSPIFGLEPIDSFDTDESDDEADGT